MPADGKTTFETIDECENACHTVPAGYSFGCSGSRPTGCVLLHHAADKSAHYFQGIEACTNWCSSV